MATPKETFWTRDAHTEGKHLVLEHYLNAWFPIMGTTNARVLFVDGFAGPGEYAGGEQGSPVIVHFHLFAGSRLKYSIFFGTRHTKGSDRMKKAIWKVAPWGDFAFRGGRQDQMILLGLDTPDLLPRCIVSGFGTPLRFVT